MLLGGALQDPIDEGVLIFKADTRVEIEEFVSQDPYLKAGLLEDFNIREIMIVAGSLKDKI